MGKEGWKMVGFLEPEVSQLLAFVRTAKGWD